MDYKNVNDYELIYRIRENDDEVAMNDLVLKYEPLIAKVAKKYYARDCYLGVDMNDFMQEGRIAVMKALKSYDFNNTSLFYTYVSVCLKRHFITYCRNLGSPKHQTLNCSATDDCLVVLGDFQYEPFAYLDNKWEENIIKMGIYSLQPIDSSILELRYNGFSHGEIGELLEMSTSSVSRHLCKIKKTLQAIKDKF